MVIAIDLDDTIMDRSNIQSGYRMGQPFPGAQTVLTHLVRTGHQIIIFTARNVNKPEAHKAVADWLDYYQIPHNGITNIKQPYFDVIIDNRAIQFKGKWTGMLTAIKKFEKIST